MRKLGLVVVLFFLCFGVGQAQTKFGGPRTLPVIGTSGPSYTGPGDTKAFTAWFGTHAYTNAIAAAGTQLIATLRNTVDNSTCDAPVSASGAPGVMQNCSNGGDNGTSSNTFCARGGAANRACRVVTLYDQTNGNACGGSSCNFVEGSTNTGYNWVFISPCSVTKPCVQSAGSGSTMASANNFTPATGKISFSLTASRGGATATEQFINNVGSNNAIRGVLGDNTQWRLNGGSSGNFNFAASVGTLHAVNAVLNGASSVVNNDGSETTGTATGSTTAAKPTATSSGSSTDSWYEFGWIDNYSLTGAERTALSANMRAWGGF